MTTAAEFQAAVNKTIQNMDRLDTIVNGGPTVSVTTDGGVVPSIAKLEQDIRGEFSGLDISDITGLQTTLDNHADNLRWTIDIETMTGATAYDKLQAAITLAVALAGPSGAIIKGYPGFVANIPAGGVVTIPSRCELRHVDLVLVGVTTRAVVFTEDGYDMTLRDVRLDCGGLNTGAGVYGKGGCGVRMIGVVISNFKGRSFDLTSNATTRRALQDVEIDGVFVHTPRVGVGFGAWVSTETLGPWVRNVRVNRLHMFGDDPRSPAAEPRHYDNGDSDWSADMIAFHGVDGLSISNSIFAMSGAAGLTISRGCRDVVVEDVLIRQTHESVNIGSGFVAVRVADLTGFTVDNPPVGTDAKPVVDGAATLTNGDLDAIIPDDPGQTATQTHGQSRTGPGWIIVTPPSGGEFVVGGTIVQTTLAGTPIATQTVTEVRRSAEAVTIKNLHCVDTGIKNYPGQSVYVADLTGFVVGSANVTSTGGSNPVTAGTVYRISPSDPAQTETTTVGQSRTGPGWLRVNGIASPQEFAKDGTVQQAGRAESAATTTSVFTYTSSYAAINAIRAINVTVTGASYGAPAGLGKCGALVLNSNGSIGFSECRWDGADAKVARFVKTGPTSTWLFQQPAEGSLAPYTDVAAGVVTSTAVIAANSGINIASISHTAGSGVYEITLATPMSNYQRAMHTTAIDSSSEGFIVANLVDNDTVMIRTFAMETFNVLDNGTGAARAVKSPIAADRKFSFAVKERV